MANGKINPKKESRKHFSLRNVINNFEFRRKKSFELLEGFLRKPIEAYKGDDNKGFCL